MQIAKSHHHLASKIDALQPLTAEIIVAELQEAGTALLCLPNTGYSTRLRSPHYDVVHSAIEAYGWSPADNRLRPPIPDSKQISRMDEALAWLVLIPADKYVLRRIVGARALVSPITGRHLHPWRRLAALLGADHKAIQRWHAQGIEIILRELSRKPRP